MFSCLSVHELFFHLQETELYSLSWAGLCATIQHLSIYCPYLFKVTLKNKRPPPTKQNKKPHKKPKRVYFLINSILAQCQQSSGFLHSFMENIYC